MKKYNSITNSYDEAFIEKAKDKLLERNITEIDLVLLEKIDGSNFSIVFKDNAISFCSRTQKLGENANFNNFQQVIRRDNILDKLKKLHNRLNNVDMIVYGEIFGGLYRCISKGIKVQKRVEYCEDNRILFFDIFIGDEESGNYLSYEAFYDICTKENIPIVKPMNIFRNVKPDELLKLFKETPNEFTTTIPALLKEYNENNIISDLSYSKPRETETIAEGYVIRGYNHEIMISDFDRFIIKNKTDKFSEIKNSSNNNVARLNLDNYINTNRVLSALSKYDSDTNIGIIINEVINDAINDYEKDNNVKVSEDEAKNIRKRYSSFIAMQIKNNK